jgi:hypothetical protein
MRRIQFACLEQTIHFQIRDVLGCHDLAAKAVRDEVAQYKAQLDRKHTQYKIIEESVQPDDSIIIKIKRQYSGYSCGDYLT